MLHLILMLCCLALDASAETLTGLVVRVSDGDTLTVLLPDQSERRIRLDQIDAPERKQPFGERAREALAGKVAARQIHIETTENDRYGRAIGRVILDGLDVNRWLIEQGWAWYYRKYGHTDALLVAESEAKHAKRGLWSDPQPEPPWDYRARIKQERARKKALGRTVTPAPAP